MVIQIYDCMQELVCDTFGSNPCSYAKNDAASNTYQLFEGQSYKFPNQHRNWYDILSREIATRMPKMMLPATQTSCLKNGHTKFLFLSRNQYEILLAASGVHMPKKMLPATHTICLKDTHTNFQVDVGIGTRYFGDSLTLYVKK